MNYSPTTNPTELFAPLIEELIVKRKQGKEKAYHAYDNCIALAEQKWNSLTEPERKELFCYLMTLGAMSALRLAQLQPPDEQQ